MNYQVAGHQTENYRINTEVYAGPLDLLLELIQKSELDITKLALAQVTDQYLGYLHELKEQDASQVSAFLVIAAKLLLIKSEALLPRPIVREPGEPDPAEALAQQLMAYRVYKQAAEWLGQRELDRLKTFLHISIPLKIEGKFNLDSISLSNLVDVANSILAYKPDVPFLSEVISIPKISIREKIKYVLGVLKKGTQVPFNDFLSQGASKIEVVVTFLAILELIKQRVVIAQQEDIFSEITINMIQEWNVLNESELEFGE